MENVKNTRKPYANQTNTRTTDGEKHTASSQEKGIERTQK